ncbi:MAG: hypothetical protein OXC29_20315 [Rhodococcus sp.]|nr:hypothetical protein [Rhodococcus sp. (in: high G+C Gram-positive bacteria)]
MATETDLDRFQGPAGPYKHTETVTIGSDDFELPAGFTCRALTTGTLVYRTMLGKTDQSVNITTLPTGGQDIGIGPGGVLTALRVIRGTSTVTSVLIGRP